MFFFFFFHYYFVDTLLIYGMLAGMNYYSFNDAACISFKRKVYKPNLFLYMRLIIIISLMLSNAMLLLYSLALYY